MSFRVLLGRDDDSGAIASDLFGDRVHELDGEADATLHGAAVVVIAKVRVAREKLVGEVAVRRVHFDAVGARFHRGSRGASMFVDDDGDLLRGELARFGHLEHAALREHLSGRPHR